MKRLFLFLTSLLISAALVLTSCSQPQSTTTAPTTTRPPAATTPGAPPTSAVPTQAPASGPLYGGVFKLINRQPPRGFYPGPGPGAIHQTSFPALEGLIRYDDKGNLVPWLAANWELSKDLKSLTLTLRKGVKFHDGTDFNAAAAKFALEERKAGKYADLDQVSSISILDDYTLRLNLSQFSNTQLGYLATITSAMTSPTGVQRNGREWAQWHPVGTGPFKFVDYKLDSLIRYERFDAYWQQGKPYLDGVEIHIINEPTTASLAFQRGEVQAMGEVMIKEVVDLMKTDKYNVVLPLANMSILIPDTVNADSPFANKKVREAVEYAIDSQALAKSLGYGYWEGPKQLAASTMVTYVPGIGRQYDPAKAKQLLSEAGFPNGFKTSLYSRVVAPQEPLVAVATMLKEVGIDATSEPTAMATYAQMQRNGWRNSLLVGAVTSLGDAAPKWLQAVNTQLSANISTNISLKRPSGWQELLDKALAAPDAETQKKLSQQLVQMNYDEAMVIVPYVYARGFVWHKNVENGNTAWAGEVSPKFTIADTWIRK